MLKQSRLGHLEFRHPGLQGVWNPDKEDLSEIGISPDLGLSLYRGNRSTELTRKLHRSYYLEHQPQIT